MAENEERSDEFHHYDVFVSSSENSRLCPNDDRIDSSQSVRLVRRSDFVYQLLTKIDHTDLRRLTVTLWATTNELVRATQAEQRHTHTHRHTTAHQLIVWVARVYVCE